MDRRVAGVAIRLWGVPPFDPAAPAWWLLVAVALAYWLGMVHWTGGRNDE